MAFDLKAALGGREITSKKFGKAERILLLPDWYAKEQISGYSLAVQFEDGKIRHFTNEGFLCKADKEPDLSTGPVVTYKFANEYRDGIAESRPSKDDCEEYKCTGRIGIIQYEYHDDVLQPHLTQRIWSAQ